MKFRIEKGNVAIRLHQFKKHRLLCNEIWLVEEDPAATAATFWVFTLEFRALSWEVGLFLETPLLENQFHVFKVTRHCGMVIW